MNHNFKVKVMNEKKIIIRELGQTLCFTYPAQFVGFSSINNCEDDNDDEEDGADDSRGDDVASDADAVITAERITKTEMFVFFTQKKVDIVYSVYSPHERNNTSIACLYVYNLPQRQTPFKTQTFSLPQ